MNPTMCVQISLATKILTAHVTSIRPITRVYHHVFVHGATVTKCAPANFTGKWALTIVGTMMHAKTPTCGERFFTNITLVRFLTGVSEFMRSESGALRETLIAQFTYVRLIS